MNIIRACRPSELKAQKVWRGKNKEKISQYYKDNREKIYAQRKIRYAKKKEGKIDGRTKEGKLLNQKNVIPVKDISEVNNNEQKETPKPHIVES
jgi:hypothetical protein